MGFQYHTIIAERVVARWPKRRRDVGGPFPRSAGLLRRRVLARSYPSYRSQQPTLTWAKYSSRFSILVRLGSRISHIYIHVAIMVDLRNGVRRVRVYNEMRALS